MLPIEPQFDWDGLLLCIADKRVIPIVGKELLVLSEGGGQILLEHYLAKRLAANLHVPTDELSADFDLNEVALFYLHHEHLKPKREYIYRQLKIIMEEERELPIPEPLKKLAAITDFNCFVSLTFDSLLAQAINQSRFAGALNTQSLVFSPNRKIEDLPDEIKEMHHPCVFHLFGQLSTLSDYAIMEEDFLEFIHNLQSESKKPQRLFDEFRSHHLLFLGCGFDNWLERFLIRTIANERLLIPRHTAEFIVDNSVRQNLNLTLFLQDYHAEVFLSGNSTEFTNILYERWIGQHPAAVREGIPASTAGKMASGAIFLSYADEDRQAVRNMRDVLDRAGLDVWFDEQVLSPGDAWDRQIRTNISHCAVFIPFISNQARQRLDAYFRKEWNWAIERDQMKDESLRFIQPVVLDDTPTGANGVPEHFWSRHCTHLADGKPTPEFVGQLKELVRNVRLRESGR